MLLTPLIPQVPGATSYMGCVGDDEFAAKMTAAAEGAGVNVRYMVDQAAATGTCAVCIKDKERSLVANLAAANNFKVCFEKSTPCIALMVLNIPEHAPLHSMIILHDLSRANMSIMCSYMMACAVFAPFTLLCRWIT